MKMPSKKPPAIPIVQLLTSADLGCSPTAAAVGAVRWAFWATDGVTPTSRAQNESNETSNRNDEGWDMSMVAPSVFPASAPFGGTSAIEILCRFRLPSGSLRSPREPRYALRGRRRAQLLCFLVPSLSHCDVWRNSSFDAQFLEHDGVVCFRKSKRSRRLAGFCSRLEHQAGRTDLSVCHVFQSALDHHLDLGCFEQPRRKRGYCKRAVVRPFEQHAFAIDHRVVGKAQLHCQIHSADETSRWRDRCSIEVPDRQSPSVRACRRPDGHGRSGNEA